MSNGTIRLIEVVCEICHFAMYNILLKKILTYILHINVIAKLILHLSLFEIHICRSQICKNDDPEIKVSTLPQSIVENKNRASGSR
jgi:hypothetical protein